MELLDKSFPRIQQLTKKNVFVFFHQPIQYPIQLSLINQYLYNVFLVLMKEEQKKTFNSKILLFFTNFHFIFMLSLLSLDMILTKNKIIILNELGLL